MRLELSHEDGEVVTFWEGSINELLNQLPEIRNYLVDAEEDAKLEVIFPQEG